MSDKKISALTGATTPLAGSEVLPVVQSGVTKKVSVDNLTAGKDVPMKSFSTTDSSGVGIAPRAWISGYKGLDFNAGSLQGGTDNQFMALQNIYRATDAAWRYTHDGAGLRVLYEAGNVYWDSVPSGLTGAAATLTTRMTLDGSNGNLALSTGNLVIGTSGKGIDFSATPGTGTSELLADYEEGTFTPSFFNLTVVGTPTYTGTYTKIGRQLTFTLRIASTTSTAATFGVTGFNLPFVPSNTSTLAAVQSGATASYGVGLILNDGNGYPPTWSANADVTISGTFFV